MRQVGAPTLRDLTPAMVNGPDGSVLADLHAGHRRSLQERSRRVRAGQEGETGQHQSDQRISFGKACYHAQDFNPEGRARAPYGGQAACV
jgi:hypothetical protein